MVKPLAENNPDTYKPSCAWILGHIGDRYANINQYSKAEEYYLKTLKIYKQLAVTNPETFLPYYVESLGNISYYAIFNSHFTDAERYANEALSLDSTQTWVKTNLVTSLLFQGRYAEAEQIALEIMNIELNGKPIKDAILEDLNDFESKGIIPSDRMADVERLRKVLLNYEQ